MTLRLSKILSFTGRLASRRLSRTLIDVREHVAVVLSVSAILGQALLGRQARYLLDAGRVLLRVNHRAV